MARRAQEKPSPSFFSTLFGKIILLGIVGTLCFACFNYGRLMAIDSSNSSVSSSSSSSSSHSAASAVVDIGTASDDNGAGSIADGTKCVGDACIRRAKNLYALEANALNTGKKISLSAFRGLVTLVVNVASECGFTDRNYKELQQLHDELKTSSFSVLAFPCNQFGAQEPHSEIEISTFALEKYRVTFPMFQKVDVNGAGAHPIFKFLKTVDNKEAAWNFEKWLVDSEGNVLKHYTSHDNPLEQIRTDILSEIAKLKID